MKRSSLIGPLQRTSRSSSSFITISESSRNFLRSSSISCSAWSRKFASTACFLNLSCSLTCSRLASIFSSTRFSASSSAFSRAFRLISSLISVCRSSTDCSTFFRLSFSSSAISRASAVFFLASSIFSWYSLAFLSARRFSSLAFSTCF
ncbi:hypothetical protein AKJ65_01520 [candidate division MSBL1 archaeon SCGC-AAA259E19]|uniref:Uncharacterized protein n=1 Tax=candidate division MSBL1 archaeon SCGC-AAA259E19 TaxID=1698264 RepID=A0A133UN03_9EURY|nr:hypothetical protein AKJ65_01520 [candidate division MSBL1 archaeon SCGC-AAA259E19]